MVVLENVLMKQYSNMKIGGIAKSLIQIEDENELINLFKKDQNYYILGNGTNTLISDEYLDINFVSLKKLDKIKLLENNEVYVQAGSDLSQFIKFLYENNLGGIENLTGIPGCMGGLINMNAGAYGTTIFEKIKSVRVFKPEENKIEDILKENIKFEYRTTEIKKNKWIVLSAIFSFEIGFNKELSDEKIKLRQNNHPLDYPNLGSTFKNPENMFAAQIISDCNLKGYQIGNMQISEKHPNFLINKGDAKFSNVIQLIEYIKKTVYEKTKINLDTEIIIVK